MVIVLIDQGFTFLIVAENSLIMAFSKMYINIAVKTNSDYPPLYHLSVFLSFFLSVCLFIYLPSLSNYLVPQKRVGKQHHAFYNSCYSWIQHLPYLM